MSISATKAFETVEEFRWLCGRCLRQNSSKSNSCDSCGTVRAVNANTEDDDLKAPEASSPRYPAPVVPCSLIPKGTVLQAPSSPVLLSPSADKPSRRDQTVVSDSESTTSNDNSALSQPSLVGAEHGAVSPKARPQDTKLNAAAPEFYPRSFYGYSFGYPF